MTEKQKSLKQKCIKYCRSEQIYPFTMSKEDPILRTCIDGKFVVFFFDEAKERETKAIIASKAASYFPVSIEDFIQIVRGIKGA